MTDAPETSPSPFFAYARRVPFAERLTCAVRRQGLDLFLKVMAPGPETTLLDVGATAAFDFKGAQYFLEHYPWPERVTCAGLEDGRALERRFGVRYVRLAPGAPWPFADGAFDIALANATVEHAGDRAGQRAFAAELARVGRAWFATTPARFFPVEMHTAHGFLHWLPPRWWRKILSVTWPRFYADERVLNLLTRREFLEVFAIGRPAGDARYGLGGCGWRSHMAAWGPKGS